MDRRSISVEGETRTPYDRSYVAFTDSITRMLCLVFDGENVTVIDEGHGGGVEFYTEWRINDDPLSIGEFVSALITLTENHGFANLIVHQGPCDHGDVS